jgi:hypothetical protein
LLRLATTNGLIIYNNIIGIRETKAASAEKIEIIAVTNIEVIQAADSL